MFALQPCVAQLHEPSGRAKHGADWCCVFLYVAVCAIPQELARQRQENEIARMNKQREIELQKAREERENERRARIMAEERYK